MELTLESLMKQLDLAIENRETAIMQARSELDYLRSTRELLNSSRSPQNTTHILFAKAIALAMREQE